MCSIHTMGEIGHKVGATRDDYDGKYKDQYGFFD
jgi:hypothetical protein